MSMRLFVDNLINVDFSYLHPTRGLVGETWLASIELTGQLDDQGMVCDFGIVKKMLRKWLDEFIDHRLLVPTQSSAIQNCVHHDQQIDIDFRLNDGPLLCKAPESAITLIDNEEISPKSVSQWCINKLSPLFPESVIELKLNFDIEHIDGPFYHYSHGLKKHTGNCQRIAHGHRSRIQIWNNGNLDTEEMKRWASDFKDIYIGSKEDLVENSTTDTLVFEYMAQQGSFSLTLPKSRCYLIDTDSTVELIAQHIFEKVKNENPDNTYRVKAFEGIGKGAVIEG